MMLKPSASKSRDVPPEAGGYHDGDLDMNFLPDIYSRALFSRT